jgi:hypothetical protein
MECEKQQLAPANDVRYKGKDVGLLLTIGIVALLLGYFCLGIIAPLIGVPVWILSSKRLSQIEDKEQLSRKRRLLNASLICSIIGVFNGPMMFFYIHPIDIHVFLPPIGAGKVNYFAANCGLSIGDIMSDVLMGSVLFIPLLFFRKTRRWKVFFIFLIIFSALATMLSYAGQAIDVGLDEQSARKHGLFIMPFFMSFILAFFPKTRKWYFLVPLLISTALLAGSQISHLNSLS